MFVQVLLRYKRIDFGRFHNRLPLKSDPARVPYRATLWAVQSAAHARLDPDASSGDCLQTLNAGKVLFNISFDITGSHLHAEIGTIVINASPVSSITKTVTEPQNSRYLRGALSPDEACTKIQRT